MAASNRCRRRNNNNGDDDEPARPSTMGVFLLAAVDQQWAIGRDGHMPWPRIVEDLQWFASFTTYAHFSRARAHRSNMVVMGRGTYESLPRRIRPLPNRITIVVTRHVPKHNAQHPLYYCNSYRAALRLAIRLHREGIGDCLMVAGGASCYMAFARRVDMLILTKLQAVFPGADTFFPYEAFDWREFRPYGISYYRTPNTNTLHYARCVYLRKSKCATQ